MEKDNWVERSLEELKQIYEQHKEKESALCCYIMTVVKILNGLSEMQYTKFHRYEKKIFWQGMEMFTRYFCHQIKETLRCTQIRQKRKMLDDIEESVIIISRVYKDLLEGTANADRHLVQSLPVDTNMQEISPKLCAFYASILEQLVKLFEEDSITYTFIPYHTVRGRTETKILLRQRNIPGKVVVVYISDIIFEKYDVVSVCLLHEAFHVLTRKSRMRQNRAINFTIQMLSDLGEKLFSGVVLDGSPKEDHRLKQMLIKWWLGDASREWLQEVKSYGWNDKELYGEAMISYTVGKLKERLIRINEKLENDVIQAVVPKGNKYEFQEYKLKYESALANAALIRKNIFDIVFQDKISKTARILMGIYRETYADIACILLCELDVETYQNSFESSKHFDVEGSYVDYVRCLRSMLVAETVEKYADNQKRKKWRDYAQSLRTIMEKNPSSFVTDTYGQKEVIDVYLNDSTILCFKEYLSVCAFEFSNRINKIPNIKEFREGMEQVIHGEWKNTLFRILSGNIDFPMKQNRSGGFEH